MVEDLVGWQIWSTVDMTSCRRCADSSSCRQCIVADCPATRLLYLPCCSPYAPHQHKKIQTTLKGKGSPYSITEHRVLELIPVLGSQPAGDVSHKPGGRLPLLFARPTDTPATLKRAATNFAAWWTQAQRVWTVCLRLVTDSVMAAIWTQVLLHLSSAR